MPPGNQPLPPLDPQAQIGNDVGCQYAFVDPSCPRPTGPGGPTLVTPDQQPDFQNPASPGASRPGVIVQPDPAVAHR
jgi:hypothetical protein